MPTLNIWLIDKSSVVHKVVDTCNEIRALMLPCLKRQSYFDDVDVYFPQYKPSPENTDLVVYYLNDGMSVAAKLNEKADAYVAQDQGQTIWSDVGDTNAGKITLHCSEVHVGPRAQASAMGLAKLTVHELMHNKFKLKDALHAQGGLAAGDFNENTKLTDTNAKLFGGALSNQRLQWMDGYHHLSAG